MDKSSNHLILHGQQSVLGSSTKGAYVLVLNVAKDATITVGKLGAIFFAAGTYAYIGSALGSAGFQRVRRHIAVFAGHNTKHKWHIDYLSAGATLCRIYTFVTDERIECNLASRLCTSPAFTAVKRFGSSDCKCDSHLFRVRDIRCLESEVEDVAGIFEVTLSKVEGVLPWTC